MEKNLKMKAIFLVTFLCTFSCGLLAQGSSSKKTMGRLIEENLLFAAKQYKVLQQNTPPDRMPRSFNPKENKSVTSDTKWWCSGFYPGTLWYIFEYTADSSIKKEAERRLAILEKEQYYTGNHDLGFMMYCSFGNAYRITQKPAYKNIIFNAANSLATRYRPSIKAIQSWDSSKNFNCPVIIDNMMNLELLEWVSNNGGSKRFHEIAVTHSNTTLKNQFRSDYSSYHVLDYDLKEGSVSRKVTHQGYSSESAWSRGQVWGLYGYTVMYRSTKTPVYLKQATNIAQFILKHPNMPADGVPFWDFDAPGIPNAPRDASAGAILASALLELSQYTKGKQKADYIKFAEKILQRLSSDIYRAKLGDNGGFLLMHSVGSMPHKSEVDVPLTYADYYFVEALMRYKKWYL